MESSTQYELNYVRPVSAQRHANADLIGSLRDGIGRDAIQSDRSKHESHNPEQAGEACYRALLIERKLNLLLHGPDARDGQICIELRQCPGEQRLERTRRHVGYQHDSTDKVRA